MGIKEATILVAVVGAVVASGCGSSPSGDSSGSAAERQASAPAPKLALQVTAPADGDKLPPSTKTVTVRGTVSPTDAQVMVLGKPAKVSGGVFQRDVAVAAGSNHIDVVATKGGSAPADASVDTALKVVS